MLQYTFYAVWDVLNSITKTVHSNHNATRRAPLVNGSRQQRWGIDDSHQTPKAPLTSPEAYCAIHHRERADSSDIKLLSRYDIENGRCHQLGIFLESNVQAISTSSYINVNWTSSQAAIDSLPDTVQCNITITFSFPALFKKAKRISQTWTASTGTEQGNDELLGPHLQRVHIKEHIEPRKSWARTCTHVQEFPGSHRIDNIPSSDVL